MKSAQVLVERAMQPAPLEVSMQTTLKQVCAAMRARSVEEALVVQDGSLDGLVDNVVGIITESDLVDAVAHRTRPSELAIHEVMHRPVHTVQPDVTIDGALALLHALRVHRLPVVKDGRVIGLFTRDSLVEGQNKLLGDYRRLTARLEDEAHHDALTGLANRRLFDAVLDREIAVHDRTGRGLGLLMLDLDHFKRINDEFGHSAGDLVLIELASRLRDSVRRSDLVARIGGEEFVVLVTTKALDDLVHLANKLRIVVAGAPFTIVPDEVPRSGQSASFALRERSHVAVLPSQDLHVTVSIGIARFEPPVDTAERLLKTADQALYDAKNSGRNCVRVGSFRASVAAMSPVG